MKFLFSSKENGERFKSNFLFVDPGKDMNMEKQSQINKNMNKTKFV